MELAKTTIKIDHAFENDTLEELLYMRQLRLEHYQNLSEDLGRTISLLGDQGVDTNPFALKKEIDEKISELKRRIVEQDQSVYLDEIELYIASQA